MTRSSRECSRKRMPWDVWHPLSRMREEARVEGDGGTLSTLMPPVILTLMTGGGRKATNLFCPPRKQIVGQDLPNRKLAFRLNKENFGKGREK